MDKAAHLLGLARDRGLKIATAESCTGGLIAAAITEIPGSSAIFDRGLVTYSNTAKETVLGVRKQTLAECGAVSKEVAGEMAAGALARSDADLVVAVTGIAGPGGSEFKPEGRVCFAIAQIGKDPTTMVLDFGAPGRTAVRQAAVDQALDLLIAAILDG
ncbi:CinA family protein [Actibacterium sp. 188UL27-1]|uniref:CinA family protein n=1 Tax=Actibacterium sp. 188UL27-1 TaxID=2786961 RepID=UPI0019572AF6|nr:CinA family protein [Actibacterium sp. 188UL27-1]MBM7067834.1 CinA family protein [Actibacterium sp. 188UL27-1]